MNSWRHILGGLVVTGLWLVGPVRGQEPAQATTAPASQPAVRSARPQRYSRPTLPALPGRPTVPTLPRPLTYRTARKPIPYQPNHPANLILESAGRNAPARPPQIAGGETPLLQVPYRAQPNPIVVRPRVSPDSMFYRPPTTDLRAPSPHLSARGRQMANVARRRAASLQQAHRGYYTGLPNAHGGVDYLNTRSGRLFLGVDNRNGVQYSIDPRTGAQVFSYQNVDGTTDYFDPRTGRWSFAVPDFAK